jgi:monomeric sarcosine oxidase
VPNHVTEFCDVIVIGAGGVGSAALYHLARRGVKAIAIDRFHPPHDKGSSHGHTRVIRQAYFEHPDYVPLVFESYRLWRELEHTVGRPLFVETGLMQIGPPDGIVVRGVLRAAELYGLAVERLPAGDVERRWPAMRVPDGMVGVLDSRAGYLFVEECVRAHLDAARSLGGRLVAGATVDSWTADGEGVRVRTTTGDFAAAKLVVAAGPWAGHVLDTVGLRLSILRKSVFWFGAASLPLFLYELPEGTFYGVPPIGDRGVKAGEHSGGRPLSDPLAVDRTIDASDQRRVTDFLARCLPGVPARVTDHMVCLYTMSPDEHFIVDRHPAWPNVVLAAGLSGHGFKIVPVLGRALADLACDGSTDLPVGFMSLGRFN